MLLGKSQRDKDETRVASIAVTRDGELLWLRRSDDGLLTLPGGHLEPREEPILGAIRELKEETGFTPPANALEYLGDDIVGGSGIHVYSFCVEIPTGEPTGANDPDSEATEFMWLDDLPESEECHVPHYNNVTLKLLGLTDELSKAEGKRKAVKEWRSSDGVRIPHHTSPARAAWDENYFKQLVRVFANGDERRLRKVKVPVSEHLSGHHVLGAVGPGGRDRRPFYSRMVAGGDKLPPIVVRRSGHGWHVVDGNARLTAALKHGLTEMDGYELSDQPIHKSETPPHPDSDFVDEDLWVQAKYRRGGEGEFKRFLQEFKGLTKASNEYSNLSGEMSAPLLYRAYKNSPHHPISLLMKYIIHRIEHKSYYNGLNDDERLAHEKTWLSHHQQGGAADKNGHVTVNDLRAAYESNPHLEGELLDHKKKLHEYIQKYSPESIKVVDGEPSVALARGFSIDNPGADHEIASYADDTSRASEFGTPKHWWVPLKNLWYSYDLGPEKSSGNFGPEDEFLATNHPRNPAQKDEVHHLFPRYRHDYQPPSSRWILEHAKNSDLDVMWDNLPKEDIGSVVDFAEGLADRKDIPINLTDKIFSFLKDKHPEMISDVLGTIGHHQSIPDRHLNDVLGMGDDRAHSAIARNPNASPQTLSNMVDFGLAHGYGSLTFENIANHPNTPYSSIEKAVESGVISDEYLYTHPGLPKEKIDEAIKGPNFHKLKNRKDLTTQQQIKLYDRLHEKAIGAQTRTNTYTTTYNPSPLIHVTSGTLIEDGDVGLWKHILNRAIQSPSSLDLDSIEQIMRHRNVTPELLDMGLRIGASIPSLRYLPLKSPNLTPQQMEREYDKEGRGPLLSNPALPEHLINKFLSKEARLDLVRDAGNVRSLLSHQNVSPRTIDTYIDALKEARPDNRYGLERVLAVSLQQEPRPRIHEIMSSGQISEIAQNMEDEALRGEILSHPKTSPEDLIKYGHFDLQHPNVNAKVLDAALEHPDHYYRMKALKHHLATPAHITKGLSDPHPEVRELAHTKILESRLPKVKTYTDFMTEKNGWKKNPDGLHKSEDFLGKSLSAIKPGKKTKTPPVLTNTETFDYSHLIPSPLLRKRFKISVEHIQPRPGLHAFRAVLHDKQNPNPPVEHQGSVQGDIENDSFRSLFAHVPENARGLGLGKALYTAVLAHVFHHHGIKNIKGWEHSTSAHHVHQALVREHGFEGYQPGPGRQRSGVPNTEGPFDDRFGEYQYTLKTELTKSIDPSELKVIWNATTRDGPNLVDHTPDLSAHPANIHPDVENYRRTVVGGDAQHKRKMGSGGITKKVMYSTPTTKFMVKPYHERVVKRIQSWQKFPIQGWAEMTNQALYHAAGLGHVHQKVHVTEHPMQTPHGTVNEPALVVHLNDGFTQAADFERKARAAYPHVAEAKMSIRGKINRQDIHKIAVMDFLSNNLDRHGGNIMFADDGRLLAVDHSRSFQYMSDNSENKWNWKPGQIKNLVKRNATMEDSFDPYLHSAINVLAPSGLAFNHALTPDERYKKQMDLLEEFQPIFDEWWPKHRQGIVDTMTHRLNQIKDPEVAGHIKRNFMERVKWMDERTRDGVENYGVDWYSGKVPWYLPGQKTDEEVAR